jgi:hypothetical protein
MLTVFLAFGEKLVSVGTKAPRAQVAPGADGLLGVHVRGGHEPARVVGADGEEREVEGTQPLADLAVAAEPAAVAAEVDPPAARQQQRSAATSDVAWARACLLVNHPFERKPVKQLVSAETVEQTLQAFDSASPEEKTALRQRCGQFQEELTAFVVAYSEALPDRERALTLALLPVVMDAFRRSGATFRKIRPGEIVHAWKASAGFARELKVRADTQGKAEPEVLLLVLEILFDTDPADMESDAPPFGAARILKVAVDCLNRAGVPPIVKR